MSAGAFPGSKSSFNGTYWEERFCHSFCTTLVSVLDFKTTLSWAWPAPVASAGVLDFSVAVQVDHDKGESVRIMVLEDITWSSRTGVCVCVCEGRGGKRLIDDTLHKTEASVSLTFPCPIVFPLSLNLKYSFVRESVCELMYLNVLAFL